MEGKKKNKNRFVYIYCAGILILSLIIGSCTYITKKNKVINIGFTAQLTGRQAELGVQERNGAQLAVDRINKLGGIDGRKVSLIIHDDLGKPEEAVNGDKELIKNGVVAIIGHATTEQTLAGLSVTNPANIIMMGPTVSTPKLSGVDDYFFRVHPSFEKSSQNFAKYIYEERKIKDVAIVYDVDNVSYSKTYCDAFSDKFKSLGGNINGEESFSSKSQPDFNQILLKLQESKAKSLLIVASDIDTALIAQRSQIINWNVSLFSSPWAQTETLIKNGGKAVEGMQLELAYDLNNQSSEFVEFKSNYKERFGNDPSFGAAYSYESTLVLIDALKKTNGNKEGLKDALLNMGEIKVLTDELSFDEFGDVERNSYLSTIKNGEFKRVYNLNTAKHRR